MAVGRPVGCRVSLAAGVCVLSVAAVTEAQVVTMCALPDTASGEIERIVSVELGRSVPVNLLGECADSTAQIQVVPDGPTAEPVLIEASLAGVLPEARARFVGMVIAELVRSATPEETPSPPESPLSNEPTQPTDSANGGSEGSELGVVLSDPVRPDREPEPIGDSTGPVPTLDDDTHSPPADHVTAEAPEDTDPVRLQFSLGPRVFFFDDIGVFFELTPIYGLSAALRWQRFLFYIDGFGTSVDAGFNVPAPASVWAFQLDVGFGYVLAEYQNAAMRLSWALRGNVGLGVSGASEVEGFSTVDRYAFIGAGMTDVVFMFPLSEAVELGLNTTVGYQQGFVVNTSSRDFSSESELLLHGFFVDLQLALGIAL